MSIRSLPTMAQVQAMRAKVRNPKPVPRVLMKKGERAVKMRHAKQQRDLVWARATHRCETCGTPLSRGSCDTFRSAHFHHVIKRSQGGSDDAMNMRCLCPTCHQKEHDRKTSDHE